MKPDKTATRHGHDDDDRRSDDKDLDQEAVQHLRNNKLCCGKNRLQDERERSDHMTFWPVYEFAFDFLHSEENFPSRKKLHANANVLDLTARRRQRWISFADIRKLWLFVCLTVFLLDVAFFSGHFHVSHLHVSRAIERVSLFLFSLYVVAVAEEHVKSSEIDSARGREHGSDRSTCCVFLWLAHSRSFEETDHQSWV